MKKILSIAVVLMAVGLVHSQVVSTEKTIGDYKKDLDKVTKSSKSVSLPDTYKDVSFKNSKTGEVRKFSELPEFEKRIFCLFQKLKFEENLKKQQDEWVANFKKLNADADKGKPDDPDTATAKASHVSKSLDGLFELRKITAVESEAVLEKVFKDFPDKFGEKERDFALKQLKEMHDAEKLIKR